MKTGWKATPISSSALAVALSWVFAAAAWAQFVPSDKPGATPAPAAKDERVAAAMRFAVAFQHGKLGDALRDHGDLVTIFQRIFGEDWTNVEPTDRGELSELFVRSMNIAFKLPPNQKIPPPPNPADVAIDKTIENGAIVRMDMTLLGRRTRAYYTVEKIVGAWRVTEVREGGEPALVVEFARQWLLMKRHANPLDFIRQIHAGMVESEQAATKPS